jgi:hypothetical protein
MRPPDRAEEAQLESDVVVEKARHEEVKSRALRAIEAINENQKALARAYERAGSRHK